MKLSGPKVAYMFFVAYLLIGLKLVPDYGMSWDEPAQRKHGLIALDHVIDQFNLGWEKSFEEIKLRSGPGPSVYRIIFYDSRRA